MTYLRRLLDRITGREDIYVALLTIPGMEGCENYASGDCRSNRHRRYGVYGADRWCMRCEVIAAIEGHPYGADL